MNNKEESIKENQKEVINVKITPISKVSTIQKTVLVNSIYATGKRKTKSRKSICFHFV